MILAPCRQKTMLKKLALCLSLLILSFTIFSSASKAQVNAALPTFEPTTGWAVNQTLLSKNHGLKNVKLPCMMATEFNNGYIVRIAGGDNKLMALAVDFRQQVFQQGRQYEAQIDIDGAYVQPVTATAFSESILLFNIRKTQGLYERIEAAKYLTLFVEDNGFKFALTNIQTGLASLESCYNGNLGDVSAPQIASVKKIPLDNGVLDLPPSQPRRTKPEVIGAPIIPDATTINNPPMIDSTELPVIAEPLIDAPIDAPTKMTAITPSTPSARPQLSTNRWQNKVSRPLDLPLDLPPVTTNASTESLEHIPTMPTAPNDAIVATTEAFIPQTVDRAPKPNNIWQAGAGDDIRGTLERWARVANVDIDWQANQAGGFVANNFEYNGQFEVAVQTLMAENAAVMGLQAKMQTIGSGYKASNVGTLPAQSTYHTGTSAAPSSTNRLAHSGSAKWAAQQGDDLEIVLNEWARKENVELIWQSNQPFNVMRGVNSNGTFEIALQALLGQYTNEVMRPAAQLNIDPTTGIRLLIVDSTGAY